MINLNEIRLCNWFTHNSKWGEGMTPGPFQWTEHHWFLLHECMLWQENVEPIELTPEILEKAGTREWLLGDTSADYWKIGDFLYSAEELAMTKGVHWLQNLHYFRTGEELQIIL
jgi:hypothetical protein